MSLLAGMEPVVWDALGRLSWSDFEGIGKQVVLRRALRSIGLGWVATNTTPFRIMVGPCTMRHDVVTIEADSYCDYQTIIILRTQYLHRQSGDGSVTETRFESKF